MKKALLYACIAICFFTKIAAQSCTMTGVYTIGSGGNYASITSAVTALRAFGMAGAVTLELKTNYSPFSETYPLTFSGISCINAINTLTIRPQLGATGLQISSSNSTSVINLDNAKYIRFDGRPGGTGTARELILSNTGTGSTVQFINDASYNTLSYLQIKGLTNTATNGIISFLTSNQSVTNGNSYNTISNCTIGDGTGSAVNTIYAAGTNGKKNSNNTITGNNIVNYSASTSILSSSGIVLNQNNTAWTIDGNSFYQTRTISGYAYINHAIYLNDTTSTGFIVRNNFIGGMAPGCDGAASQYSNQFVGIKAYVSSSGTTSIQNNTITNISLTGVSEGYFIGIVLGNGKIDCGSLAGNTIGSATQAAAILINAPYLTRRSFAGISIGDPNSQNCLPDTVQVKNSTISGIKSILTTNNYLESAQYGIWVRDQKSGYIDISNNTIGSTTLRNSFENLTGNDSQGPVKGIYATSNTAIAPGFVPANTISNNLVMNLYGTATGIEVSGGRPSILSNTIRNLLNAGTQSEILGIKLYGVSPGTLVSSNNIYWFTNINPVNGMTLTGIKVTYSNGFIISKNLVHTLQPRYSNINIDYIYGLDISGTAYTLSNNMVRLGTDSAGGLNGRVSITAIRAVLDSCTIIHNSAYIGGSIIYGNTVLNLLYGPGRPCRIANNILVNNQLNSTATSIKNYVIQIPGLLSAPSTFSSLFINHNIYYTDTANGYIGSIATSDYSRVSYNRIIDWRKATGLDSNSMLYSPNFINASGDVNNGNLHLANPNPAEGAGLASLTTTDDIDGDSRAANSPVDIGADAGHFVLQDGDAPILTHQAFLGQPVPSNFIYQVKITDNGGGIDTSGTSKPRMWFRKKYPATSSWYSNAGTMLSGNPAGGIWGFRPDFVAAGFTFNPGDSVEYYFVAQDKGPVVNVGYSNTVGVRHTSVTAQVTAPTIPLQLLIYGIFPNTIYVGTGQIYPSLTNDGGFFEASKKYLFDTATTTTATVYVTSSLSETGKHFFNTLTGGKVAVTIGTNTTTVKAISSNGTMTKALITLQNTDRVTIDGAVNGTGRYLLFINTAINSPYGNYIGTPNIDLDGKAHDLTITNCLFESNVSNTNSGMIDLYGLNNKRIVVRNNLLSDISGGPTGFYKIGILVNNTLVDDSVIIRGNYITNFLTTGISLVQAGQVSADANKIVVIDSNHLYYTSSAYTQTGTRTGISVASAATMYVKDNFIGGSAPYCGGTPWMSTDPIVGITMDAASNYPSFINGNTLQNFRVNNWATFSGIRVNSGMVQVGTQKGNLIGSSTNDSSIVLQGSLVGIYGYVAIYTSASPLDKVENNVVAGTYSGLFLGIDFQCRKGVIMNNEIFNNKSHLGLNGSISFTGMKIWMDSGSIVRNRVYNLYNLSDRGGDCLGIDVQGTAGLPNKIVVTQNKVFKIGTVTTIGTTLCALRTGNFPFYVHNNQLSVSNEGGNPTVKVYGLYNTGQSGTAFVPQIRYNTIYIGGSTTGTTPSYGMYIDGGAAIGIVKDNLIYNERTSSTNKHLAVGIVATGFNTVSWNGPGSGNNLYITADTTAVNEWKTNGAVTMRNWRNLSAGDSTSFAAKVSNIPSAGLFTSTATGNLNINTQSPLAWYLNGKGIPFADIAGDYDNSNIRSTSIATGPTDIGSHEFTPASQPPGLVVNGLHQPGGTDTLSFAARTVATLTWGNTGTLPTLGNPQWFSGVWPNDTTNNGTVSNARFMSGYLHIPATGGSGYSYKLTYYYDSSMLGKVTSEGTMVINKRQSGIPGSWQVIWPSVVNTALKTISIDGQTSFSEFTATDANAPLPIRLLSFAAVPNDSDVLLSWAVSPSDEAYFVLEKSYNSLLFTVLSNVMAQANGGTIYSFNDQKALQKATSQKLYYRLKMVSKTGEVSYSNIVAVAVDQKTDQLVQSLLPNPFHNTLSIQLKLNKPELLTATIFDNSGKVVYKLTRRLDAGYQSLSLNKTAELATGVYWLHIIAGEQATTIQLLKEKN